MPDIFVTAWGRRGALNSVLVIDGRLTTSLLQAGEIEKQLELDVVTATKLEQVKSLLREDNHFGAAVVDPKLSDDPENRVVDLLLDHGIPVVVYTSHADTALLEMLCDKPLIDTVDKAEKESFNVVLEHIERIIKHHSTPVMIVDDSMTTRILYTEFLANLNLRLLEASSAAEALQRLEEYPDTKLIVTDYNMPEMNGVELTKQIRKHYARKELCIIGVSAQGSGELSVEFLKNGANDFISKPFLQEELVNRVLINLDVLDYIERIQEANYRDFLTKIYNRKYVFEMGEKLFENAKRGSITLACAMIDIDHFKKVNDTYGHDVGDKVIVRLAEELNTAFRKTDIVARLGGEEFCVVLSNPHEDNLEAIFDEVRQRIEALRIDVVDEEQGSFTINFTVSIGVTAKIGNSFDEMLKFADQKLYEAKNYGRNLVVL